MGIRPDQRHKYVDKEGQSFEKSGRFTLMPADHESPFWIPEYRNFKSDN